MTIAICTKRGVICYPWDTNPGDSEVARVFAEECTVCERFVSAGMQIVPRFYSLTFFEEQICF